MKPTTCNECHYYKHSWGFCPVRVLDKKPDDPACDIAEPGVVDGMVMFDPYSGKAVRLFHPISGPPA